MSRPSSSDEWVAGRYSLRAAIGSGGVGTIHLGRDVESPRAVAIKRLHPPFASDPSFVARFLDEARCLACVRHPNVLPTLDAVRVGEEVFLVTEYVAGETLANLVYGKARPPYRLIVAVVRDVLQGLQAAHTAADEFGAPRDIVHGDMCPENILVGADGISRIFEFGVEQPRRASPTKAKLVYMAPDRLRGGRASVRTDLYAAGVLLWQLVTGKRLFKGESTGAMTKSILDGDVPSLMGLMLATAARKLAAPALADLERLDTIVMRAITADPDDHYESAHEMATDLARNLTPASPAEVAAWVNATAHDVLASRAQMVAEIMTAGGAEGDAGANSEPPTLAKNPNSLLPILVADLADAAALLVVAEVATARGTIVVPLLTPPGDAGDHVLEVHVPDQEQPTLFFARPAGAPEPRGFPLALRPYGEWSEPSSPRTTAESKTGSVRGREAVRHSLTESHSRDLTHSGSAEYVEPNVLGRTLQVQGGMLVLEERLGAGGGGAVYRARYTDDEREDVAVKVQHDHGQRSVESCARFHAEALAASKLDHRNLVRVIDFGQEPDGLLHLTMEYVEGASLRQILEAEGPLPMERAVKLLGQVCAGLAHAHRRGVVHRDVKPSNVIVVTQRDDDGRAVNVVKVCDFGIATGLRDLRERVPRESRGPATGDHETADDGRVTGTPQYMSPEQCRGEEVDPRSDVYSCGVMLYELVTGQLPFQGRERADFRRLHLLAAPTPPSMHVPDIDPLLEQLLLKALAKTPEGRHQSMLELRSALKELLEPAFVVDPGASVLPPARPSVRPSGRPRDEAQPLERSVDALVGLLHSLSEIVDAPPARLREIEKATESLEGVLEELAARGDAVALGQVIRAMAAVCEEARRAPAAEMWAQSAATCATRVLRTIAAPMALVPSARKLLAASTEPTEAELSLLVWARVAGAYALYTARMGQETRPARTRFVSAMRLIGPPGLPVVRGALDQLLPLNAQSLSQPTIAVDLLRSLPGTRDEGLGMVISRFARRPEPEIQEAALATLVHVWGERATPALLAGMQSPDEKVRITAVRGVRTIGGVDELAVRRIEGMLWSDTPASDDLRAAAADALGYAASVARPPAARAALRVLRDGSPGAKNTTAIAFARASLLLAPDEARKAIEERAARGPEPLRSALLALL